MKRTLLFLASSLVAVVAAAPSASAQTRYSQSVTVKASDWDPVANPGGVPVLVLGANEQLALTDVIMTHNTINTTGTFRANIRRGPASNPTPCATAGAVLTPFVSPLQTVALDLSTGLAFQAGEQICIVVGGASGSSGITFNFSGIKN
jgi:hypothetical protein